MDSESRVNPTGRFAREAGNTLLLAPVAVLILFGLGAIALDSATLFLGQRRLADLAAAVADDAVAAVDRAAFYGGQGTPGTIPLDRASAEARRDQLVALANDGADRSFSDVACTLEVVGPTARATCTGTVRPLLAPMLPGMQRVHRLSATERAEGQLG